jgi:RNA polymerase sigma-70 factor (ECF subfamily)
MPRASPSGPRAFADLHALARRHARRADEADDLVQTALLAALESGRRDFADPAVRRWLSGVIRNRAAFDARTAARRRARERRWTEERSGYVSPPSPSLSPAGRAAHGEGMEDKHLPPLSPALRVTALLALNGCTRAEIGWLLNLSDAALRQRLSQLRRALADASPEGNLPGDAQAGALAFGRIRRALLGPARRRNALLASHDPDGHLFVVSRSHFSGPRQHTGG